MLRTWRNQSDGDQHSQWVPIRSASFRDYLKSLISGRTGVGIANVQHGVVVCGLYRPCLPQLYLQRQVLHEEHEVEAHGCAVHLCAHEEKVQCGHQQIPLGKMSLGVLLLQGEGHLS